MRRLQIAQLQIKSYMNDRLTFRACDQEEITALGKLREALALIGEAEAHAGRVHAKRYKEILYRERESDDVA